MPSWNTLAKDIYKGDSFARPFTSADAQKAQGLGYSVNDINEYLRRSAAVAQGNEFAVGGFSNSGILRTKDVSMRKEEPYYKYIGGGGGAGTGAGGAGGGGGINYGSGQYGDITAALKEQAAQGKAEASSYQSQAQQMQAQIDAIRAANELSIGQANESYQKQLADSKTASEAQLKQLQDAMLQQQGVYQQQLALAQQQQQQAASSLAEQQRQNAALQTAFVPSLEPTAAYNALGDNRELGAVASRKAENNQLSSLSIINPYQKPGDSLLAGLQLA